jgi:hypothetical protein
MLFVRPEVFALLASDKVKDLCQALQIAVRLEHATMPPYLYALYSLGSTNPAARGAIRAIVQEEMLHMLLACNILNAVGEAPKIDYAGFVLDYPSPLPGTVAHGLQVPLKPFSKALVNDVFMVIEEPEHPLNFPEALDALPPRTIGEFYAGIRDKITALGPTLFTGDPAHQVQSDQFAMPVAQQRVTDATSAAFAIDYIVHQGEGTTETPVFDGTGKFAHYYRFKELAKGLKLQPNPNATSATPPDQRYQYGPVPIAIDESVVLPLRVNPRSAGYPAGPVRDASDACNKIYTQLLGLLQQVFDGAPGQIDAAITLMTDQLKPAAAALTGMDLGDGTRAGPTFEYLKP